MSFSLAEIFPFIFLRLAVTSFGRATVSTFKPGHLRYPDWNVVFLVSNLITVILLILQMKLIPSCPSETMVENVGHGITAKVEKL
jgi:hypothetical protein